MSCACGSGNDYENCCEPYIKGIKPAPSAEALMRSRYTAHVEGEIEYLGTSLAPDKRSDFDVEDTRKWATNSKWQGLEIRNVDEVDARASVEFIASYVNEAELVRHHELATFRKEGENWFFVNGSARILKADQEPERFGPIIRANPKVGRNEPCPCGSGKKYKKCCA
ncbi:MAG: YchJ family protein [Candidatus Lindowbacteria bacterium]|nr:YchJ family protein [Candidatus Lindowbacteria bacterium]